MKWLHKGIFAFRRNPQKLYTLVPVVHFVHFNGKRKSVRVFSEGKCIENWNLAIEILILDTIFLRFSLQKITRIDEFQSKYTTGLP